MPRNYRIERDAIIQRWYGDKPQPRNPRPRRSWAGGPITPADCLGIPMQVNSPFIAYGYCMVWKYSLNRDGYGTQTIEGKQELVHRAVFIQTRGQIPEDKRSTTFAIGPIAFNPPTCMPGPLRTTRMTPRSSAKRTCSTHPG